VSLSGLSGSVWSGEISQIDAMGKSLSQVEFSVNPLALFGGKLSLDLDIAKGDIQGDVNIVVGSDYAKTLELNDTNLEVEAKSFQSYLPIRGVEVTGEITSKNLDVQIENKRPTTINGQIIWKKSAITFAGKEWVLGDFIVETSTDEKTKKIIGKLLESKNKLDLKGQFSLDSKGVFEFIGDISTDSEQALYQAFALFNNGKPANGRLPIKFKQKIL